MKQKKEDPENLWTQDKLNLNVLFSYCSFLLYYILQKEKEGKENKSWKDKDKKDCKIEIIK